MVAQEVASSTAASQQLEVVCRSSHFACRMDSAARRLHSGLQLSECDVAVCASSDGKKHEVGVSRRFKSSAVSSVAAAGPAREAKSCVA